MTTDRSLSPRKRVARCLSRWLPAAIVFLITTILYGNGLLRDAQNWLHDLEAGATRSQFDSDLVLVDIDTQSLKHIGQWPWGRDVHAQLLDRLVTAGAGDVFFDIDFSSHSAPTGDEQFSEALSRSRVQVYLPVFLQHASMHGRDVVSINKPLQEFAEHAEMVSVNLQPDSDGLVRKYSLGEGFAGQRIPSYASRLTGEEVEGVSRINYRVDPTSIGRISYHRVLDGDFPSDAFTGRHVIVGATALELGDVIPVPVYRSLSGPVVQAMAYLTLSQAELVVLDFWIVMLGLFILAVSFNSLVGRLSWRTGMVASALVCSGIVFVSMFMMARGLLVDDMPALMLVVLGFVATQLSRLDRKIYTVFTQQLRILRNELLMTNVVENIGDGVITIDDASIVLSSNRAARKMFGVRDGEWSAINVYLPELGRAPLEECVVSEGGGVVTTDLDNGVSVEYTINRVSHDGNDVYTLFVRDVSLRKKHQDMLEYQASHDILTGLSNRQSLTSRVDAIIDDYDSEGKACTLMLINLNGMGQINDVLGHETGDCVLVTIAHRLLALSEGSEMCARVGGDEFALLFHGDVGKEDMDRHVVAVMDTIGRQFEVDGLTLSASANIGIAAFPEHAATAHSLLTFADVAMREARKTYRSSMTFKPRLIAHMHSNLKLSSDLELAINNRELDLHYQPKVSLSADELVSFEALARWDHPELGRISPDSFIAVAESSTLIWPLTLMLVEKAIKQYIVNRQAAVVVPIAVNISVNVLVDSAFMDELVNMLARYEVSPDALILEVTESAEIYDQRDTLKLLAKLRDSGFRISIDDFGTGNASISYLKDMPANELKIDRSFITHLLTSASDRAITESVVELAHRLGLHVVAEGIEDRQTYEYLASIGCDIAQGYWVSKPLSADLIQPWYEQWCAEPQRTIKAVSS